MPKSPKISVYSRTGKNTHLWNVLSKVTLNHARNAVVKDSSSTRLKTMGCCQPRSTGWELLREKKSERFQRRNEGDRQRRERSGEGPTGQMTVGVCGQVGSLMEGATEVKAASLSNGWR